MNIRRERQKLWHPPDSAQSGVYVTRVFDTYVHVSGTLSSQVQEGRGVGCRLAIVCNLRQHLYRLSQKW